MYSGVDSYQDAGKVVHTCMVQSQETDRIHPQPSCPNGSMDGVDGMYPLLILIHRLSTSVVLAIANDNESTEYSRISPVPTNLQRSASQPARNILPLDSYFGP